MQKEKITDDRNGREFDHTGHRDRLREEFRANGAGALKDYELLELILFYSIPRKDTRPIARRLINKFGSFAAVLDADEEELRKIDGVGEHTAALLELIPAAAGRYLTDRGNEMSRKPLDDAQKISDHLLGYFVDKKVECFYILCLDSEYRPLLCEMLNEGGERNVAVNLRRLGSLVCDSKARNVVIAHNHPFGAAKPSAEDISLTEQVAVFVRGIGARLTDHLIFGKNEVFSMAGSGLAYSRYFL